MTISNKLALMATLIVSMNTLAYDVVGLKNEVELISNYAQNHNYYFEHKDHYINVGYWLDTKINSTYKTSSYEIVTIANAIKKYNPTSLITMIENEREAARQRDTLIGVVIATTYTALLLGGMYQELIRTLDRRYCKLDSHTKIFMAQNNKPETSSNGFFQWLSKN